MLSWGAASWRLVTAGGEARAFFMVSAAWANSSLPTRVEPVKPIFLTTSDFISALPVRSPGRQALRPQRQHGSAVRRWWGAPMAGASPLMQLYTPSGRPALWPSSARAKLVRGVDSAGFCTTCSPGRPGLRVPAPGRRLRARGAGLTVHPAAMAGTHLRVTMLKGKSAHHGHP